ncbi:hypothetical protein HPHPP11B_1323 [Helicobacter pylori Hp P-11b]|uniref:Uncharacterized protein n=1 Tax=Helicobacter pylori Hp P-11b TaxID=992106 RepID=I9Y882_HELPX|nr:hypothetical protein HPHPP11B_1323 [Helicobacter pylori Hp P-11b]
MGFEKSKYRQKHAHALHKTTIKHQFISVFKNHSTIESKK